MKFMPERLKKRLFGALLVSLILLVAAVLLENRQVEPIRSIHRPSIGGLSVTETFVVELEEGQGEVSLQIGAMEYTEEQVEQLHAQTEQWLLQVLPGENESLEVVTKDLFFPGRAVTTGGSIRWSTDAPWLIRSDGTVCNEGLEEPTVVEIKANVEYGSEVRIFTCTGVVHKKVLSEEEQFLKTVQEQLEIRETASRTEEVFEVPGQLSGRNIQVKETQEFGISAFLFLVAFLLPVFVYSNYFSGEEKRRKERKKAAENGYMEFVTKLSLMMAAGITVRQCFCRLAEEYEKHYGTGHILTKELKRTKQELEHGYSESRVYEDFGRRCGVLSYQRMASLLVQNSSKGIQGIGGLLVQEAKDVMAQERANVKVRGEQAGTKLLFPMMGLLFLVFAILLMPAFQSF